METAFRSEERFSQDEFVRWLDENQRRLLGRCELIDGAIVMTLPGTVIHGRMASRLHVAISNHVAKDRLGEVFVPTTGYGFASGDTLDPDVSFVSNARKQSAHAFRPDKFPRAVPNLVVEVLSPSTSRRDRTGKKRIYARNGVDEYWIVDSNRRQVTIFRLEGTSYTDGVAYNTGSIRSQVLPGLELTIEELFADADGRTV